MKNKFYVLFIILFSICFNSFSNTSADSLLLKKINLLEIQLNALEKKDSLILAKGEEHFKDTLYVGLFERYSTRTENLISWILGIISVLVTVIGFFTFRRVFREIRTGDDNLKATFDQEIADHIKTFSELRISTLSNQYQLYNYLGMIYSSQAIEDTIPFQHAQSATLAGLMFYKSYKNATEENKEDSKTQVLKGLQNIGAQISKLEATVPQFTTKEDFLRIANLMFLDLLDGLLIALCKESDEKISKKAFEIYSRFLNLKNS